MFRYSILILLLSIKFSKCFMSRSVFLHNTRREYSSLSKTGIDEIHDKILKPYEGPILNYEYMEAGCSIDDIGVEIMIGLSLVAPGRGLYIRLNEDVDNVTLPMGTPLCGYSRGRLTTSDAGDKTVGFSFSSVSTGVIFRKKLMPLIEAVQDVALIQSDLTRAVQGHLLTFNETNQEIEILPDPEYTGGNYFVPDEDYNMGPGYFGMFANDMAYRGTETSYNDYLTSSRTDNILQIVWRIDLQNNTLVPTWPVVILSKDVLFTNKEPMECGMHYSWRYWLAYRYNEQNNILENENQ